MKTGKDYGMKKMAFCIIPVVMALMGCSSGGTAVAKANGNSPGMDLDAAIREAAAQMEAKIPSKTMIALVSVASPSTAFSTQVLTRLESAVVGGGKLVVVDRANLDKVREEQGFQLSGEVDDESAKSIGRLLGAGAIVTGSLADLGDVYSLTLKAINIETATVAVSYLADLAKSARVETLLASGGGVAGTGTRSAQAGGSASPAVQTPATSTAQPAPAQAQPAAQAPAVSAPAAPPAPVYKIGDTGPAGGIIFYDKGNNSDGWRYLEAAPAEAEKQAPFYINYRDRNNSWLSSNLKTEAGLGTGRKNTSLIVSYLASVAQWDMAAQVCDELELNGYDDWYMPSFMELSLMYGNLYRKGLGDFKSKVYYSSTLGEYAGRYLSRSINFEDGSNNIYYTEGGKPVRAIRQF